MWYKQFIGYRTILMNELRRTLRIWPQTLLPSAMTTTLYFLIFGYLMGQRIGTMNGMPYINFIIPGLIMMNMIMAAYNAAVSVLYMSKWSRSIEEVLVSSMSTITILCAYMSVGILRGVLVGLIVLGIAELFTHVAIMHYFFLILVIFIACAIFSLLAVINALLAKNFDQISIVPTFVIMPLSYLGGVFFSLSVLPNFWQIVALFNPILYLVSTLRYAFVGHAEVSILWASFLMLLIFAGLFYFCWYLLRNRKGLSG
jgi:ABC-2 type transport system permease protein